MTCGRSSPVRMSPCQGEGSGFDSHRPLNSKASTAKLIFMANREILTPAPIEIRHFKPAGLTPDDYQRFGLVDLVAQGYGYQGTDEQLLDQAQTEYDGIDQENRFDIFLALSGGRAVGSLSTIDWSPAEPNRGEPFWRRLGELNYRLSQRALDFSGRAFAIAGIVTHPEARDRKIAKRLLQTAVKSLHPAAVVSQTKTPAAVLARANALRELDYRTYYGIHEVTSGSEQLGLYAFVPAELTEAYLYARQDTMDEYGLMYQDAEFLLPEVPDTDGFPSYIQKAFKDVIKGQQRVSNTKTVTKPIISVHRTILT